MADLHDLRLVHYSARPLPALTPVLAAAQEPGPKPLGLWLSVEDDPETGWRAWCEGENFALECLAVATPLALDHAANVLHLNGADTIDTFTSKYSVSPPRSRDRYWIDWPRVAAAFDGIIIAPYVWERRLSQHTFWYYGWDCASGCVWNTDIIRLPEAAAA